MKRPVYIGVTDDPSGFLQSVQIAKYKRPSTTMNSLQERNLINVVKIDRHYFKVTFCFWWVNAICVWEMRCVCKKVLVTSLSINKGLSVIHLSTPCLSIKMSLKLFSGIIF